jgi:hypothetical protein
MAVSTPIPLIEIKEMRTGRGGKAGKGQGKYTKYKLAINPHVEFLRESIENSKDGKIRVKSMDVAAQMGPEFKSRHATSLYWGLKYSLFDAGIIVTTGKTIEGEEILVMRFKTAEDKLPESLEKNKEKDKEINKIDTAAIDIRKSGDNEIEKLAEEYA